MTAVAPSLPLSTLRARIEMVNERLEGKYILALDYPKCTADVLDSEETYLFTVPAWAMEDTETAHLVTLAMGEAYDAGRTDRHNEEGVL